LGRLWPGVLLWVLAGAWALTHLPGDGSAGVHLGLMWAMLLFVRRWPWARWGLSLPRWAGLCCPAPQPRWSDVAMGWMMGTLWWHAEGCLGRQLPAAAGVAVHLGLMLALVYGVRPLPAPWRAPLARACWVAVAVLLLCWGTDPQTLWLCMLLLTLAWACEPVGSGAARVAWQRTPMLAAGPLGLWAIHWHWPVQGADALQAPLLLLSLLAGATALVPMPRATPQVFNSGGSA
jgi:hypothetical protein